MIDDGLTEDVAGGTTGVFPESWSIGLRVTYALLLPALWLFDMDGGVVFCRRADFQKIGGYNDERLFAEDVEFLFALRRLGKERRPCQRLVRLQEARTLASNRKFDKYGQWHFLISSLRHSVLIFLRPKATEAFAREYWYEDR